MQACETMSAAERDMCNSRVDLYGKQHLVSSSRPVLPLQRKKHCSVSIRCLLCDAPRAAGKGFARHQQAAASHHLALSDMHLLC